MPTPTKHPTLRAVLYRLAGHYAKVRLDAANFADLLVGLELSEADQRHLETTLDAIGLIHLRGIAKSASRVEELASELAERLGEQ